MFAFELEFLKWLESLRTSFLNVFFEGNAYYEFLLVCCNYKNQIWVTSANRQIRYICKWNRYVQLPEYGFAKNTTLPSKYVV